MLDGYTVVDLRAAFALRDDLELYGRLENAFDEEYETIARLRNSRSRRVRRSAPELLTVHSEMQIAAGRFAHHGGRLGVARSLFPDVPQPWVDLSTGINPRSYPAPRASQRCTQSAA